MNVGKTHCVKSVAKPDLPQRCVGNNVFVLLQTLPIVDGSTGVSAVLDVNHKNGKTQEPHAHGEADAVHGLVAHKHLTVEAGLQVGDGGAGSVFTEAWDLQPITGSHVRPVTVNTSLFLLTYCPLSIRPQ